MSPSGVLLDIARAGDEGAFRELVEPHRRELQAHCYRMLGSLHDAEDALQDALLRAWRGLPGFEWRWRHLAARANGQPAVGAYTWRPDEQCFRPFALDVLTLRGDRIQEITSFIARSAEGLDPDDIAHFPTQPPDPAKVASIFEGAGLPGRLD